MQKKSMLAFVVRIESFDSHCSLFSVEMVANRGDLIRKVGHSMFFMGFGGADRGCGLSF